MAQDTVKVSIEEVRIPITAKDTSGRFDPTVELNDLLVRDNGITQPVQLNIDASKSSPGALA